MSDRIHGTDKPAANEQLPKSIWQPGVVQRLADYIKQLRQVDEQSNEPNKSGKPDQPHICPRNPHRVCNCSSSVCADDDATYRYARGPYLAATCPVSGRICLGTTCRDWCESGVDRTKT
jgi:hypothetical protein